MKRILIVEDDALIAKIYRNKCQVEGFAAEIAGDGEQAIQALKSSRPDLVMLDLQLPRVNGVEVLKFIRTQPATQTLPVIVLTNAYLSGLVAEAWEAGATRCLTKANFTPSQVMEVVRSAMGNPERTAPPVAAPVPTPVPAPASATGDTAFWEKGMDFSFQDEVRAAFLRRLPQFLASLRGWLQACVKSERVADRLPHLQQLCRKIHSLSDNAAVAGLNRIAQIASALEALLKELAEKPANIHSSSLHTVARAVDLLGTLFEQAGRQEPESLPQAMILVVDDEVLSRRAVCAALQRAHLRPVSSGNPDVALALLAENRFDLIFLDVMMPGLGGFEMCEKLRTLPANRTTPVVFVTSLSDFESRARSRLSGGSDYIAKPFLLIDLAVRALTYVYRDQGAKGPVDSNGTRHAEEDGHNAGISVTQRTGSRPDEFGDPTKRVPPLQGQP